MFTDTTHAPRIPMEGYRYSENVPFAVSYDSTVTNFQRTISETHIEFHGLTFAAADSIAATKRSASTDSNNVDARWFRQDAAGNYGVRVVTKTRGPWVEV